MSVVTNSFQKRKLAKLIIQLSQRACDERDFDTALRMLRLTETFVTSSMIGNSEKRPVIVLLVAGYELLWTRRHREATAARMDAPDPGQSDRPGRPACAMPPVPRSDPSRPDAVNPLRDP